MNEHDLFDALSMIDPKFIDEAAFEAKENTANTESQETGKNAKVVDITKKARIRKILYVALPSVAAILLIVGVAIPAMMKVSQDSAPSAAADAAPSYSSEAPMPAEEAATDSAAPAEAMAEAEATTGAADNEEAVAEAPASENTYKADEDAAKDIQTLSNSKRADKVEEAVAEAEEAATAEAAPAEAAEAPSSEGTIEIMDAVYEKGELSVIIPDTYGRDPASVRFTISRNGDDKEGLVSEGFLDEFVIRDDRYVLDLSKVKIEKGTYTLKIDDSVAEFTVR